MSEKDLTYDSPSEIASFLQTLSGATIERALVYLGSPAFALDDGRILVFEYDEGYYYSEYTAEGPSFSIAIINPEDDHRGSLYPNAL